MRRYNALPNGHTLAGRLVIERSIGRGKNSAVYKALDLHTKTPVALKILDPFLAQDPVSLERFRREVTLLRTVDHPNVVKLYEFIEDGELEIICMEYIDGMDGKAYVTRFGRLPLAEFLALAKKVVAAVDACHRLKILHRDLKPQNVLITPRGDVKLVDFGISKINSMSDLTKTGTILGTPEYMAPELFRSTTADPRSDLYALGAIFYEFLTGRPPYVAASLSTIMTRQLRGEIEAISTFRKDLPLWVQSVVMKCLRTDPQARYQSGYELLSDLQRGEHARAVREAKTPPVPCLNCKSDLIPGLPFCHQCGRFSQDVYEKGPYSLVFYGSDDVDGLDDSLRRIFPLRPRAAVKTRLRKPPVVLFRGISQHTATTLLNELGVLPCELRITRRLLNELKLPRVYIGFAILAFTPLLVMGGSSALQRLALTAVGELALATAYLYQIRPLVQLATLRRQPRSQNEAGLIRMARQLKELSDPGLKTLLGHIVSSMLRACERVARTSGIFDANRITAPVRMSLDAAKTMESYELYLSSRSLNDLRDKLGALDVRLRETQDPTRIAALIDTRTKLQKEFTDYQLMQDLHGRISMALLNLNAVLRRIEDSTQGDGASAGLDTELQHLEDDLKSVTGDERRAAAA